MLKYLSLKHCRIYHKRGSNIKNKKNIIVLKTQNDNILQYYHDIDRISLNFDLNIGSISINDLVCRKHINQMERDLMNNNSIDINNNNVFVENTEEINCIN
jgi:hypothetical protein